jgi:hypothetical protein
MIRTYRLRPCFLILLFLVLASGAGVAQQTALAPPPGQRYKLTVIQAASSAKRVRKGRISSQSVVKVSDQNDAPVAGVAVTFTITQLVGGGASFANGALTSIVTTNAAGVATSGTFTATAGTSFTMGTAASVPGGVVTASVPVTASATAAAGAGAGAGGGAAAAGAGAGVAAGISTGVIVGIVGGVAAAAAAGIAVGVTQSGGKSSSQTSTSPSGTIGAAGTATFGQPQLRSQTHPRWGFSWQFHF